MTFSFNVPKDGRQPMYPIEGKTAMVTGASRGIGSAVCVRLAEAGADIAGVDIDEEALGETGERVKQHDVSFMSVCANVSDLDQMKQAVSQVVDRFDGLDVLVNNAGITRDALLIRMRPEDWQNVLAVNLTGVFNGMKAAARTMMRQRSGSIVNIASVVGMIGNPGQCNYAASKAGVMGLTKSAAREMASRNIRVNAVAPGYIVTRMTEKLGEEAKEALMRQIPLERLGQPEDVAEAVLFLASDASSYLTGQVLRVDGGMVM